ncbi:MAG: 1-phosphofructokinase family hexose kinase [Oscillospiraceae bacterium]|nr:1-phosphofructokinase family hexose kinase [Oscillospiraceae bacterium]
MKIATLTLNPAVDRTMYCGKNLKFGALNRAVAPSVTTHGGKGTNVSCVFKILGIESTAYGFIGGDNGDLFLKLLEPYNIKTDFTRTKCNSRMNFKIISGDGEPTEFNEAGGPIIKTEKEDILNKIKNIIGETDFLFMGGSVPPGIEKSIYRDIINLGGDKTKFIIDCDGEALKLCMNNKKKPYIIKPNQFELEQFTGKKFDLENNFYIEIEKVKEEAKKIYKETGAIVLCTLGEYGGLYCGPEGIYYLRSPKVEVRGFTGAGDTFLAAFCAVWSGLLDLFKKPPSEKGVPSADGGGCRQIPAQHKIPQPPSNAAAFATPFSEGGLGAQKSLAFAVAASAAKVTKPGTEFASFGEMIEMYGKITKENG